MNTPDDYTGTFGHDTAEKFAAIVRPLGFNGDVDDWHEFREFAIDGCGFGFAYDGPASPTLLSHVEAWADGRAEAAWMYAQS